MTVAVLDTINLVTAWVAVGVVAIGLVVVGFGDKILEFLEAPVAIDIASEMIRRNK